MSVLHVRQIESRIRETYAGLWQDELDEAQNLSRLLAQYAVDLVLGDAKNNGAALVEITDGEGDRGIDAVGVDPVSATVVVVQSKWRHDGSGSVDLSSIHKFVDGTKSLLDIESEAPSGCSADMHTEVRRVMDMYGARIRMVVATTAANDLSDPVREPIEKLLRVLNDIDNEDPVAACSVLTQSQLFDSLATPSREAITFDLQILDWGRTLDPVKSYYGRVSAAEVASWFDQNGPDLFAENIRVVLPRSEINEGILQTATMDPEWFWYYNNGITILAAQVERPLSGATGREAGMFRLVDASIVNGAQTVSTLGKALAAGHGDQLARAFVTVRCIEVSPEADDLARRITRFANTQNVVTAQDFVFLDEEQHRIKKELQVLGYEYLLRSGEVAVSNNPSEVIDIRQAAVALACASQDVGHAVLAKREVSRLFAREGGPYKALFNPMTDPLLLIRSVEIIRAADRALGEATKQSEGIRAGVAIHGRQVIVHRIIDTVGRTRLKDPDFEFDTALTGIEVQVLQVLDMMTGAFPANSYPGNVFKNRARVDELLKAAATD